MRGVRIEPYAEADNHDALALEAQCTQGKSLVLRFQRPTFHARSEVYKDHHILCAKVDGVLAGIVAWAEKRVLLHGERIKAVYCYDLRVLPAYRHRGVAMPLTRALFDAVGHDNDCIYTLVAAENARCVEPAQRLFGMKSSIPFTNCVLPVYRPWNGDGPWCPARVADVHDAYLWHTPVEFVTGLDEERLTGWAGSTMCGNGAIAGCSLWTNANLLAEEVVDVPRPFRVLRAITTRLPPFIRVPTVPHAGELLRSWFLFDLFAQDDRSLRDLLAAVNNHALTRQRQFLYVFLQDGDPLLRVVGQRRRCIHRIPYLMLAKGKALPRSGDQVYLDVRDL